MVYFIQERNSQRIKIGQTEDVERRVSGLQVGNSDQLVVLKVIKREHSDSRYHYKFQSDWVRGEWFHPSETLMAFIETIPESPLDGYTAVGRQGASSAKKQTAKKQTAKKLAPAAKDLELVAAVEADRPEINQRRPQVPAAMALCVIPAQPVPTASLEPAAAIETNLTELDSYRPGHLLTLIKALIQRLEQASPVQVIPESVMPLDEDVMGVFWRRIEAQVEGASYVN